MDDAKNKMKGFMKNLTTSNSKFKGQGHVLGSSTTSSSSPNPIQSRLIPPPNPNPKPKPKTSPEPAIEFNCPICSSPFPSESAVSAHIDVCLPAAESSIAAEPVNIYLSNKPSKDSVEVLLKLLGNVVRDPGNDKFRRIRMGNPKIKEAMGDVKGGTELLEFLGFRVRAEEEGGEVWGTMKKPGEDEVRVIKEAVSLLEKWRDGSMEMVVGREESKEVERKKVDRQVT